MVTTTRTPAARTRDRARRDVPKNYITPAGHARIRAELLQLIDVDRPEVVRTVSWAASNGDRSENGDYIYGKRRAARDRPADPLPDPAAGRLAEVVDRRGSRIATRCSSAPR